MSQFAPVWLSAAQTGRFDPAHPLPLMPAAIERELTWRSAATGVVLGIVLTPSNVYAGLKIGWSFNMSIIALLVGYGIWQGAWARRSGPRCWTIHESNISQTTASAAASIVSGGLVAPLPAYALLTGHSLPPLPMMAWVFSVSLLGIWIAWYLRPSLMADASLRFPEGIATLETLQHIYSHGKDAMQRLGVLCAAGLLAGTVKGIDIFLWRLPRWSPTPRLEQLTFAVDPSLLLVGFGGIIGPRVGASLFLGACVAWGGVAPWLLDAGWVKPAPQASGPQFAALVEWLLWPGVSILVSATLSALAWQWARLPARPADTVTPDGTSSGLVRRALPAAGLLAAGSLVVSLQVGIFDIDPFIALLTVPFAALLAAVAARIVGATGIPPIGAIGQVSQLGFGMAAPGQIVANLMSANTAGGAAGQCTDLMNDFRVGHAIGATPLKQAMAQTLGIAVGSIVGVIAYRALIPDPQAMLLTPDWPAPAVATWKAVAETLSNGLSSLPASVRYAIALGALAGLAFGLAEALLSRRIRRWLPSGAAFGLAFLLPASVSLLMAFGALCAAMMSRWRPGWAERFVVAAAAGLIAGESIVGILASLWQLLRGV